MSNSTDPKSGLWREWQLADQVVSRNLAALMYGAAPPSRTAIRAAAKANRPFVQRRGEIVEALDILSAAAVLATSTPGTGRSAVERLSEASNQTRALQRPAKELSRSLRRQSAPAR